MARAIHSQSIKGGMRIELIDHPVFKHLVKNLRKPEVQNTRLPTNEDLIFHTTIPLHEKTDSKRHPGI